MKIERLCVVFMLWIKLEIFKLVKEIIILCNKDFKVVYIFLFIYFKNLVDLGGILEDIWRIVGNKGIGRVWRNWYGRWRNRNRR